MSTFSDRELTYLTGERRLARIATVGRDGTPHVVGAHAEAIESPQAAIRIHPERIDSWGFGGGRNARAVG